jgi:transporter family-2 protein
MSVLMDHYGWLGIPVNPVSWTKMLGFVLLVAGVLLIRGK